MPDTLRQRKRFGNYLLLKTSWKYQAREYFENSTLHGVRYVAERGRSTYQKTLWFTFVSIGAIVSLIIIIPLWGKFQKNPTITGVDTDFHRWHVPFPGITLCPRAPHSISRVKKNVYRILGANASTRKVNDLKTFIRVISKLSFNNVQDVKSIISSGSINYLKLNFRQLVLDSAHRCEDYMMKCTFKQEEIPCCMSFRPTFTEHGLCLSFNTIHSEVDWPWKPPGLNTSMGELHRIYETDMNWSIEFHSDPLDLQLSSARVFIHDGNQLPGLEMRHQLRWESNIGKIFFGVKTTYTTENARQLSIKQRKCVFKDEIKLVAAKEYSYWACMNDCRMKLAKARCSCIPFTNFAVPGFPYCDMKGMACLANHADELRDPSRCSCELGCENSVYQVEKITDKPDEINDLEIGFVSWPMIRYQRGVLFGWIELLVAFGGIAGLFLGFSLLSGFEIIYYFTLRAACMVYRNRSELEELRLQEELLSTPRINLSIAPDFKAITEVPPVVQSDDRTQPKTSENLLFVSRVLEPGVGKTTQSKPSDIQCLQNAVLELNSLV